MNGNDNGRSSNIILIKSHESLNESELRNGNASMENPSSCACFARRVDPGTEKNSGGDMYEWQLQHYEHFYHLFLFYKENKLANKERSSPSTMSFVLCRRKVPERMVTKPHISVTIWVGFCRSQSCIEREYSEKILQLIETTVDVKSNYGSDERQNVLKILP